MSFFQALRKLLDFSDRVTSRVDIPAASTVRTWIRTLRRAAGQDAGARFKQAVGRRQGLQPYTAIVGQRGRPPPALILVLDQAPEEFRTSVDSRLMYALDSWDTDTLREALAGDSIAIRSGTQPKSSLAPDVDLTSVSPQKKRKSTRAWSKITGIVLHQTGVHNFGESAWKNVTAHVGVHSDGRVFHIHPFRSYLWSSHTLNRDTVAIEVAGNFLGDLTKPNSYWKKGGGPSQLTDEMISGLRRAIRWIMFEVASNGGKITHIYGHRQGSKDRPLCPGAAIWQQAGVWAQIEYGLSDGGNGYTRGDGLTIPESWDPRLGDDPNFTPDETSDDDSSGVGEEGGKDGEEAPAVWSDFLTPRNLLVAGAVVGGALYFSLDSWQQS